MRQALDQRVDRTDALGPMAGNVPNRQPFLNPSLFADDAADAAKFIGGSRHHLGDIVEGVRHLPANARPLDRQADIEIAFLYCEQSGQELFGLTAASRAS